jgi:DNA-binding NarL/FixJ family response regulator
VQHARFWVLCGPEVHECREWVVLEGCLRRAQEGVVEAVEGRRESISDIAAWVLQKAPGSIHGMIEATTGGFSAPQRRRRRRCALTPAEREEISRGLATGESLRTIASRLGRCASTVCREVNRNGGRRN